MKKLRPIGPLAAVLGLAIWLTPSAFAACSGTDTVALVACIGALEAKVDSLQSEVSALRAKTDNSSTEQKLSALTADNAKLSARVSAMAAGTFGSSGDSLKAPFVVTDDAGNPIFKVVATGGGGAEATIGSSNQVQLLGNGSGGKITVGNSNGRVGIWTVGAQLSKFTLGTFSSSTIVLQDAGSQGGLVRVQKGAEGATDLVADDKMTGVKVYTAGKERANLGVPSAKGGAVRVFSEAGNPVAAMGANLNNGGAGAVYLGNGTTNGVELESSSDAQGSLSLLKDGSHPVIQLRAIDTTIGIFNDAGVALGALMMSTNSKGGNLTLNNANGQGVVSGGGTTAGDGALCVSRIKNGQTCLGIGLPMR